MRNPLLRKAAGSLLIAIAVAGGVFTTGVVNIGGGGGTANRFVATTGTDTGTCSTSGTACLTFNYANQQAACGDAVSVASGSYPRQEMADVPAKDSSCTSSTRVTFQPATGATVHLAGLELGCSVSSGTCARPGVAGPQHVKFLGGFIFDTATTAGTLWIGPGTDDVVVDGVTGNGVAMVCDGCGTTSADSVTVRNSTFANAVATALLPAAPIEIQAGHITGTADNVYPNITLDNVTAHDISTSNANNWHGECIFIKASNHVTIQNSTFYRCQIFDIFIQDPFAASDGGGRINNVHVINNLFGQAYQVWSAGSGFSTPNNTAFDWGQAGHGTLTSTGDVFAFNSTPLECAGCQDASKNDTAALPTLDLNAGDVVNATITGNIGGNQLCANGAGTILWQHNLTVAFSSGSFTTACGTNTNQAWNAGNFGYASSADPASGGDLTLAAGSPAIGLVPLTECQAVLGVSATDRTGLTRPSSNHNTTCNSGANENR